MNEALTTSRHWIDEKRENIRQVTSNAASWHMHGLKHMYVLTVTRVVTTSFSGLAPVKNFCYLKIHK